MRQPDNSDTEEILSICSKVMRWSAIVLFVVYLAASPQASRLQPDAERRGKVPSDTDRTSREPPIG